MPAPTGNDTESRVRSLVLKGTESKLMQCSPGAALGHFKMARDLARGNPTLALWSALAAYRMGHLYLQGEGGKEGLQMALDLFTESASNPHLGPRPWIYRLPVLHRLGRPRREIQVAYEVAIEKVKNLDDPSPPPQFSGLHYALNSNELNLLELSCCCLGLDYNPLRGMWSSRVDDFGDLRPNERSWTVLETRNGNESAALQRSLAEADFNARLAVLPS